jgi:hypothetical protein
VFVFDLSRFLKEESMKISRISLFPIAALAVAFGMIFVCTASAQQTFYGNGAGGFGGPLGNGSLTVTNDGVGNVTFSLNTAGSSLSGNDVVVYLYTGATGLSDTSTLSDNADGGREAVSGYNAGNPSQSIVTFPSGLQATFALSIEDSYESLFQLPLPGGATGNNSLTYVTGASQGGEPDVLTIPLTDIGLTQGQSFQFDATLISDSAYRSNETIGATSPDVSTQGNPGYSGGISFSSADTVFTPEPSAAAILALCAMTLLLCRPREHPPAVAPHPAV